MPDTFNWDSFLKDWQAEVLPLLAQFQPDFNNSRDKAALEKESPCFTGASDAQIKMLAQRLAAKLPPRI